MRESAQVGGVRVILGAMQRLVGNTEVQWKGADVIRTLISEKPQVGWGGVEWVVGSGELGLGGGGVTSHRISKNLGPQKSGVRPKLRTGMQHAILDRLASQRLTVKQEVEGPVGCGERAQGELL